MSNETMLDETVLDETTRDERVLDGLALSEQTLAFGEQVCDALLSVDALYRQESGDEDGLVVLNMAQSPRHFSPYPTYADAAAAWQTLRQQAASLPELDRRCYYMQLCESTLAFIEWREHGLPFQEQLSRFLHVPAAPASDGQLDELRGQLRSLLTTMGYSGDLATQCAAWEARNRVPADEIPGVLEALLDEAWDRTEELFSIPAPKSDGMRVTGVSGVAFNARCNYLERQVELNTDPILTRPGLKHLAIHEACPGHYVQFKLRESWYRAGTAPADNLLSVVNTASSSPFEGIADNGMAMLNWYEDENDRIQMLMNRYRAGIGTVAAWKLHAEEESTESVTHWLRANALSGGEGWAANRMRFISAPSRAVLIWSYWWGEPVVTAVWEHVPATRRVEFIRYLYGRMHSLATVKMFQWFM